MFNRAFKEYVFTLEKVCRTLYYFSEAANLLIVFNSLCVPYLNSRFHEFCLLASRVHEVTLATDLVFSFCFPTSAFIPQSFFLIYQMDALNIFSSLLLLSIEGLKVDDL